MSKVIRKRTVLVILALLTGSFIFITGQLSLYRQVRDNSLYMRKVFLNISEKYAEHINLPELYTATTKQMVRLLDPYTEFISKDAKNKMELITEGAYGGLGMEIGMRDKRATVIAPIDDTPAQRAGIRAGDMINKINGKSTENWSLEEVSSKLRGKVGTDVTVEFIRPGMEEPLVITLTRAKIKLKDVPYYTFVKPGMAYVKLSGFTENAPKEFENAIRTLQNQDKIQSFILDLRSNPGGLLGSAVKISNVFLDKGKLIVATEGAHEKKREFQAFENPILGDVPVVVLVDHGSASASEIVTGALKDWDRGVVIGDTTYGKGLVQKLLPLDDEGNVQLKITTAKYFTPSGRCIQRQDYKLKHRKIFEVNNDDSLLKKTEFKTAAGRSVFSGGGIAPDVLVKNEELPPVLPFLWRRAAFFKFAVDYLSKHKEISRSERIKIDDKLYQDFITYLQKHKITYQSPEAMELKRTIHKLEKRSDIKETIAALKKLLRNIEQTDQQFFQKNKKDMMWALELEMATQFENKDWRYDVLFRKDKQLKKAKTLLSDSSSYSQLLTRN